MYDVSFNSEEVLILEKQPGEREIHRKSGCRIAHFQRDVHYDALEKFVPRQFNYYSICHLLEGQGWYWSPGNDIRFFSAGEGVISTPGYIQSYGGYKSGFVEDYICFYGPVVDYMYHSGVFENGIINIGRERRLLPVIREALNLSDSGQIRANAALQSLLYDLFKEREELQRSHSLDRIDKLLETLSASSDQWWTVSRMADVCHLSENQFRRLFKKRTGMGPKHYIDSIKIQIASEMLLSTGARLDDIALRLGYIDRFHFSKVFKRIKGISPDRFRKNYPM